MSPGLRAHRARFPTCGVIRVAGYSVVWDCISTSEFFLKAPKGALRPCSVAALLHFFLWCASEYSVVGRIICHSSHDNVRTNVCQWLFTKNLLPMSLLNRFDSISNLYISLLNISLILLRWIFQRRITQRWKIQYRASVKLLRSIILLCAPSLVFVLIIAGVILIERIRYSRLALTIWSFQN